MLESFLQAQKISVRKSLQRGFRKYLTYGEASNQLLMHKLQGLVAEVEQYKLVSVQTFVVFVHPTDALMRFCHCMWCMWMCISRTT